MAFKVQWAYVKMVALLALIVFLFAFATVRNNDRKVSAPEISFLGDNNLFITQETVSKLLIQKTVDTSNLIKETLDLNALEFALNSNPMIKSAEVFVDINGELNAEIEQKKPIARIRTTTSYYLDDEGGAMPLSSNYTARVPFVVGHVDENNLSNVFKIAQKVYNDTFLKQHVVEIHQNDNNTISLKLRQHHFSVYLGNLNQLDKKVNNLKVFYKKALKDGTLNNYSNINLQFDNQVVCTKN
ncbi:cell division protein FtsQ/DivIB [Formosa sp. A9]|uniref:cell division protein FtsQ/DivIB n=1 Tax=Formosa sp. A9 TaxID=3442641 RepID=UPI003EBE4F2A